MSLDQPHSGGPWGPAGQRLWSAVRVRSRAWRGLLPLPLTSAGLLLLLVLPALLLQRMPRPRAVGLEQLLTNVSLLQSFPPTPDRPVPLLWRQRLGAPLAAALWRQQRGPWWQLWGDHTDAPPLLAYSSASGPGGAKAVLPPNALAVGDLVVVAADPLSRQLLKSRLLPQQPLSRGLNRRCLERLRSDQAVFWTPAGLAAIAGPLEPLLQGLNHGCLSLSLEGNRVSWQGEASSGEGLWGGSRAQAPAPRSITDDLAKDRLLEIEGGSLDPLLKGLLSRSLIREPLSRRYGLDAPHLDLLRRSPFRLTLLPLPQGPFKASLQLQLLVERPQRQRLERWLEQLGRSLLEQGLTPLNAQGQAAPGPGSLWRRDDGVVVGGWRWIERGANTPQLLLFLGPAPTQDAPGITLESSQLPRAGALRMRSRPSALAQLSLLPPQLPELVPMAAQLSFGIQPSEGAINQLQGALQVPR